MCVAIIRNKPGQPAIVATLNTYLNILLNSMCPNVYVQTFTPGAECLTGTLHIVLLTSWIGLFNQDLCRVHAFNHAKHILSVRQNTFTNASALAVKYGTRRAKPAGSAI